MKRLLVAIALTAAACGGAQKPGTRTETGKPGVQTGYATWYSGSHHNGPTASGERFNKNAMTAAHRTLPLGTRARVTNLETGRSEVVEIEDRGPHVRGRIIDVSPRTAERLGMREDGTAQVEVRPIEQPRQR